MPFVVVVKEEFAKKGMAALKVACEYDQVGLFILRFLEFLLEKF